MERSLYIVLCGLVLVGNWCVHGATFIRDASNTDMNNIIDETGRCSKTYIYRIVSILTKAYRPKYIYFQ